MRRPCITLPVVHIAKIQEKLARLEAVSPGVPDSAFVYNQLFRLAFRGVPNQMIRFLQTPGPIKKIVLGGLLTFISVMMAITLIPGIGSSNFLASTPTKGVVVTVSGEDITSSEVRKQAKRMLEQQ